MFSYENNTEEQSVAEELLKFFGQEEKKLEFI